MRTTVTLDSDARRLLHEPRFKVAAKPMRLRTGLDPFRLHDLDAALEVETFKVLTASLEQERSQ